MTDMRATERLLRRIEELARANRTTIIGLTKQPMDEIIEVVTELRRRGDTLVRRDDLRNLMDMPGPYSRMSESEDENARIDAAIARLENALGGKLRP